MSGYKNFIIDFPSRCNELLKQMQTDGRMAHRNVTSMLAIAAAGFVIPFERLKADHPGRDKDSYEEVASQLKQLQEAPFIGSTLWPNDRGSWLYGDVPHPRLPPDEWPDLITPRFDFRPKTFKTLNIIRNALAHGNIITTGGTIRQIIFVSSKNRERTEFHFVAVSPKDFLILLTNWFIFLGATNMPTGFVSTDFIA